MSQKRAAPRATRWMCVADSARRSPAAAHWQVQYHLPPDGAAFASSACRERLAPVSPNIMRRLLVRDRSAVAEQLGDNDQVRLRTCRSTNVSAALRVRQA